MKRLFFWMFILSMVSGLPVAHDSFAKTNSTEKAIVARQPDKMRTQLGGNSDAGAHNKNVIVQRTRKSINTGTMNKKNSSSINGTTFHRKH